MKYIVCILLIILPFSESFCQQFNVESWSNHGNSPKFFIADNGNIVYYGGWDGIFLYNDSVLIQQITSSTRNAFKGRFGNVLFAEGNHSIVSWSPNGSFTYPGDSSFLLEFTSSLIQLPDGRIFTSNGSCDAFVIYDSTGITLLPDVSNIYACHNPVIEINPDLYLFAYHGFGWADTLGYFNSINNSITKVASSQFVGANPILSYDSGPGNKIFMRYQDGLVEVENNSVIHIAYYASLGINLTYPVSTSLVNNKYAVVDPNYFLLFENGNLTYYDSSNGWNLELLGPSRIDASPNGSLYIRSSSKMYKVSSALFTGIEGKKDIEELKIYPNPSKGVLFIDKQYLSDDYKIVIQNLQGKVVFEKLLNYSDNKLLLPEALLDGLYLLNLIRLNDTKNSLIKFIIDRD